MQPDFTGFFLVNLFVKGGSPKFDGCLLQMKVRQTTVKQIKKGGVRSKYLIKSSTLQPCPTSACRDCLHVCPQLTDSTLLQCQGGGRRRGWGRNYTGTKITCPSPYSPYSEPSLQQFDTGGQHPHLVFEQVVGLFMMLSSS